MKETINQTVNVFKADLLINHEQEPLNNVEQLPQPKEKSRLYDSNIELFFLLLFIISPFVFYSFIAYNILFQIK